MEWLIAIGALGAIVGPIIAVLVAHHLNRKTIKIDYDKKLEGRISSLETKSETHDANYQDLKEIFNKIPQIIKDTVLATLQIIDPNTKIKKFGSPPELTDLGVKLATESGIDKLIGLKMNKYSHLNDLEGVRLYEGCQKIAKTELGGDLDKPEIISIKDHFYKTEGLDTSAIIEVFALRLRDTIKKLQAKNKNTQE